MLIHLLHFITMWLNNLPTINGISPDYTAHVKLSYYAIFSPTNIIATLLLGLTTRHMRTMNPPIPCIPTLSRNLSGLHW